MPLLSPHQQLVARAIAPKITGALSMMGSVFIITDIVKSKEKMGRTYSRILLVMSLYDFFTSLAQFMSTWPMPADTAGVLYASGTTFTCNFQGFFTQLGVGAPMYNCSLSFYYLIVIAFAYSEQKVKQIEWFLHLIPLTISIGSAIAGLPLTLYNAAGLWCWIGSLPGSCAAGPDSTGDCQRGDHAWIYRWGIYYAPVWFCVLTITINMSIVSYLVWAKEKKSLRFRFPGKRKNIISLDSKSSDAMDSVAFNAMDENAQARHKAGKLARMMNKMREKQQAKKERQGLSSQVFWQAFYYVVAFYITWIFPTVLRLMQTLDQEVPYWILLTMAILLPLQGFFNFLVYIRPRVVQYRRRHPEYSFCSAMFRSMRKTVHKFTSSEMKLHTDTVQDTEVLDPCHALSLEKAQNSPNQTNPSDEKKRKSFFGGKSSHVNNDGNSQERAPNANDAINQRHRDEMKLLEEEDPSFYEGQSSRSFEMSENVGGDHVAVDESHNEEVYMDEGVSEELSKHSADQEREELLPEKVAARPTLIDSSTDEEEESGDTNQETQTFEQRYPEFASDPDFWFM